MAINIGMAEKNKILLVDDETEILALLQEALEEEGYEILTARDGVEGLAAAFKRFPDLILLDMNMPRMSGMEVYHKLYNPVQKKPTFPVLAVTARGDLEGLFRELNVDGFVTKPFKLETIVDHVNVIFEKRYGRKPANAPAAPVERQAAPPPVKPAKKTHEYLIVDEGARTLGKVISYFSNYGYEARFADTALQAIGILMERRVDALLINLNLPDLPGDLLLFKLREMPRTMDIPVILYSSTRVDTETEKRIIEKTRLRVTLLSENNADLFAACKVLLEEMRKN